MAENKQLTLHIYPAMQETNFAQIYSDAGDGYGTSRLDKFCLVGRENNLEITWEEEGEYPFFYTDVHLHLHGMKLQKAWVDDVEMTCEGEKLQCGRFEKLYLQLGEVTGDREQ